MMRIDRLHLTRILANFAQLFSGFVIGLMVIRLLLTLGEDVYGVIAVLAAGAGIAQILRDVASAGTVPKLGEAWHSEDQARFKGTLSSSLVLSLMAGFGTLLAFGLLTLVLGVLEIPPELRHAAVVFIWLKAIQAFVTVSAAPIINMLVVCERMIVYNLLLTLERAMELMGALVTLHFFAGQGASTSLIAYGALVTLGGVTLQLVASSWLMLSERRFRPHWSAASWGEVRSVWRSVSWNAVHSLAMNFHLRFDVLIMNAFFGLKTGMLFSIAGTLAFYVRQLTMALVKGLDAVSARHRSRGEGKDLTRLAQRQMFLQACLIFPAALTVLFATEDLMRVWLGNRLEDPESSIPIMATICRILVVGVAARSMSESWAAILAGAGQIRRFAPYVLWGAAANPVCIALFALFLPEPLRYLAPACSLCVIFVVVHLVLVPFIAARFLHATVFDLFRPCIIPLGAALFGLLMYSWLPDAGLTALDIPVNLIGFLGCYGVSLVAIYWLRTFGPLSPPAAPSS